MEQIFDVAVIGAGVVGASVFNKCVRVGKSCLMIDKASDVATGASKANSGLVHAGYDPKPNTLKAEMNILGNKLYPNLCKRLGVKLIKTGALVVGNDIKQVQNLFDRGVENGVSVEIWDRKKILKKAPNIADCVTVGLFAKDAYVVSPYLLTIALTDEAIINGGKVCLEEDIVEVLKKDNIFEIVTKNSKYYAKNLVNSAGSGYNEIARLIGSEEYPLEFRRGEYFVFDKGCDLGTSCTIFPLPTKIGKGVLVTPTVDGNFLVGPTSQESDDSTKTTYEGLAEIKVKANMILKEINFKNTIRQFSGIRVVCGDDFIIEKSQKIEGVINLAGICSPGLTSAPAIAERVVDFLGFENVEKKCLKKLPVYKMFKDMTVEDQQALVEQDKNYCKVICKCEKITKADILNALRRPLQVSSIDGVKRRTNAGMGRCQGGFCFGKVASIIAEERKMPLEEVKKENRNSNICLGNIREVDND